MPPGAGRLKEGHKPLGAFVLGHPTTWLTDQLSAMLCPVLGADSLRLQHVITKLEPDGRLRALRVHWPSDCHSSVAIILPQSFKRVNDASGFRFFPPCHPSPPAIRS